MTLTFTSGQIDPVLAFTAGDTPTLVIPMTLAGAVYTPPVGATGILTVKADLAHDDSRAVFQKSTASGTLTFAGSSATCRLITEETRNVTAKVLYWSLRVRETDSDSWTVASGRFKILPTSARLPVSSIPIQSSGLVQQPLALRYIESSVTAEPDVRYITGAAVEITPPTASAAYAGRSFEVVGFEGAATVGALGTVAIGEPAQVVCDGTAWTLVKLGVEPAVTWSTLSGKPSTFPPSTHSHAQADITGLTSDLTERIRWALLSAGGTITATPYARLTVVATATIADPTPAEGLWYEVLVVNGTVTCGGIVLGVGDLLRRVWHSGSWRNMPVFAPIPLAVVATTETVTNSATLTASTQLQVALGVGTYWVESEAWIEATSTTAAGMHYRMRFTGTATEGRHVVALAGPTATTLNNAAVTIRTDIPTLTTLNGSATTSRAIRRQFTITVTAAGTLLVEFAQHTAAAGHSANLIRGYINARRIA